jgi:TolB-like protein/cytochrome c-type biogenesis protein CcmH/NrfG
MPEGVGEGTDPAPAPSADPVVIPGGKVFISYASHEAAIANALCDALEAAGIPCWIAPRDVRPGDFYADAIVHAITNCPMLVLVLSQAAIDSPHVLREVERASSKRRPIITFRIDTAPLPPGLEYFLSASQWLDASGGSADRQIPKLIEAVRGRGTAGQAAPSLMGAPLQVSRKRTATVAVLTALVAAILVYSMANKFRLSNHVSSLQHATAAAPAHSVAVLPFVDMSEKKDQEYFSDGMSEELIDMLTKIPGLRVPARTSSFYFKGKAATITDIANALSVLYVLEGSVRTSGKTLRVTAQLIRADNGYHLWSQSYDRDLDDIFKVQDEIAGAVTKALKLSLLEGEEPKAAQTTSGEAYTLYVQAKALILHSTVADAETAANYLQHALRIDPRFAPAWARLAQTLTFQFELGSLSYDQARNQAGQAVLRALEIDPTLAAAHLSSARVRYFFDWDWPAAETEIQRALQVEPENADALRWAGALARTVGHLEEAVVLFQKAIDRDPLDGANYAMLGSANVAGGRFSLAEVAYRKALELSPPEGFGSRASLRVAQLESGQAATALAGFEQLDRDEDRQRGRAMAYFALGQKAKSDAAVAELEGRYAQTNPTEIAEVHAFRGDIDEAFVWLDRAVRQRDNPVTFVKTDRLLAKLRGDPRYTTFLRKMNLQD